MCRSSETLLQLDTEGLEAVYIALLRLPNASTVVLPRLFAALQQTVTQIERFVQEEVKQEAGKQQRLFFLSDDCNNCSWNDQWYKVYRHLVVARCRLCVFYASSGSHL